MGYSEDNKSFEDLFKYVKICHSFTECVDPVHETALIKSRMFY